MENAMTTKRDLYLNNVAFNRIVNAIVNSVENECITNRQVDLTVEYARERLEIRKTEKLEGMRKSKRMFPIQLGEDVTWEEGEQYYHLYAERYGDDQSIERIAERGGFSHEEIELLVKERNE